MIDLYGMSSPNVRKVVILLEELGLAYRTHHVAVFRGAQFDPQFLARNPLGKVPVLVDGEKPALFESGAILIYLAETYGGFLPAPPRYEVLKWLFVQTSNVGPIFGQHNHFIVTPSEHGGYAARRYREQAARLYRVLEDRLAASPWLGGDDYSIADIATYPWATYVERHGFAWADYPALGKWRDRVEARPAVRRAAAVIADLILRDNEARSGATTSEIDRFFWRENGGPPVDLSLIRGRG